MLSKLGKNLYHWLIEHVGRAHCRVRLLQRSAVEWVREDASERRDGIGFFHRHFSSNFFQIRKSFLIPIFV